MKRQNIYKGHTKDLSEFSHRYVCWANRRNQWAKAKAKNKRIAKKRRTQAVTERNHGNI